MVKGGHYTVETRYNECSWDHENLYVITINSLYALYIELFARVGTKKCVRYIHLKRYLHVRYSEFPLYNLDEISAFSAALG